MGDWFDEAAGRPNGAPGVSRKQVTDFTLLNRHSWRSPGGLVNRLQYLGKGNHQATWALNQLWVLKYDLWECKQAGPSFPQKAPAQEPSRRDQAVEWANAFPFLPKAFHSVANPYVHFQERGVYTLDEFLEHREEEGYPDLVDKLALLVTNVKDYADLFAQKGIGARDLHGGNIALFRRDLLAACHPQPTEMSWGIIDTEGSNCGHGGQSYW